MIRFDGVFDCVAFIAQIKVGNQNVAENEAERYDQRPENSENSDNKMARKLVFGNHTVFCLLLRLNAESKSKFT